MSPFSTALTFLVLGHVVGDFVFQTGRLAAQKRTRLAALVQHVLLVLVAHVLALLPLRSCGGEFSRHWLWLLPALALAHAAIDAGKIALERHRGESLATFLIDQALHLGCLLPAAWIATRHLPPDEATRPSPDLVGLAVLTAAFVTCTLAGSAVVRLVLQRYPLPQNDRTSTADDEAHGPARMGHAIGVLERMLALTFILLGAWTGIAGIIAAKSIARFKDLERRHFGEYYLIGTLTSLLVTVAVGVATVRCLELLR